MLGPGIGSRATDRLRLVGKAATAGGANVGKESLRYVWIWMKMPIMPNPKGARPMAGTSQKTPLSAAPPYQKNEMGTKQAKKTQAGRRISGSKTPLFAFVMRTTVASESLATAAV